MAANKEIHEFAIRWFEKYRNSSTKEYEVGEGFGDECFALGFEMDCGKAFEAEFPDTNALNDYEALDKIIEQVQDFSGLQKRNSRDSWLSWSGIVGASSKRS